MNAIRISSIYKGFGEKKLFADYSLNIPHGTRLCLMGESGRGKTTLLNLIMGVIYPDAGVVEGVPKRISAVFQEDRLCEGFSAVSNVLAVTGKDVSQEQIIECLNRLGLGDSIRIPVSMLSGGMRRRVAIARALLAESDLIIMDEPFAGLDDANREKTAEVILDYAKSKTLIIATHDIRDPALFHAEIVNI